MNNKLIGPILLSGILLLLTACSNAEESLSTEMPPVPTATPVPTRVAIPTPPPWGLLTSLPVEVSAVLAAGPLLNESTNQSSDQRTFIGFGMPKEGNSAEVSPQWEFAVPPGTPALAPVTGYVVSISTLWSDDLSVWLSADGGESQVWEVEHVIDVKVAVGDYVEAGQPIATASVFGGREIALVELGLFKGGQTPTHYCPMLYVDENAESIINAEFDKIRKENFDRLSARGISIPEHDPDGQSCWTDLPVFQ